MNRDGIVLLFVLTAVVAGNVEAQIALDDASQKQMVMTNLSSLPLAFTENQGQFGEKTLFKASAGGATFYFCNNEVAYLFVKDTDELIDDDFGLMHDMPDLPGKFDRPRYKKENLLIKAQFIGANPNPEVIGIDRLPHNNNYFLGNDPSKWRTDVPNYSTIIYKDIYPGIDLKYYGDGRSMKYDFVVNPGANISKIKIRYEGVNDLSVTPAGDLQANTRFGLIHEKMPYAYQEIGNVRHEIIGRYEVIEQGVFGFTIDDKFNSNYPLIIDPELIYSTYLGGDGNDEGYGIAVDASGNAYVTGDTYSSNFPTIDPYQADQPGTDVFVIKFAPGGSFLIYSTYLGGNSSDRGYSIAVDASGNAYVTGDTYSDNFPIIDSYQTNQPGDDVFVTKLAPGGNTLVYSTYLGGNDNDRGYAIAVDAGGSAYVTGDSYSSNFPTADPYQTDQPGMMSL